MSREQRAGRRPEPADLESLRQALATALDEPVASGETVENDVDRMWRALDGELSAAERSRLFDRLAADSEASREWILAQEMWRAAEAETPRRRRATATSGPHWLGLAAAAAVLLALAAGLGSYLALRNGDPPEFRTGEEARIESLLHATEPLRRASCRLAWTGIEGARYRLQVTTESLEVLADVQGLVHPEYRIAEERLRDVEPGSAILWRVEARLPDGETVSSSTFRSELQ